MKHPFDVHVGARLRECRRMAGMTRQEMGARIGVDAQEVQCFEEGEHRVDSTLLRAALAATGVSPAFLFEGLAEALRQAA